MSGRESVDASDKTEDVETAAPIAVKTDVMDHLEDEELSSRRARDRLFGALSSAVDRAETNELLIDGIPDLTAGLDTPLKRIINSSSPWSSPTKSPRAQRRRRKKEVPSENVFHHTFVMKLFDRSVDLAQFQENTALYPVCRAWMKNQPHNTNLAPRLRTPTPEPKMETLLSEGSSSLVNGHEKTEVGEGDVVDLGDGGSDAKRLKVDDDVLKLPIFQPLEVDGNGVEITVKLPKAPEAARRDFYVDQIQKDISAQEIIKGHMIKWQSVRRSWREAYNKNEERYKDSMDLLNRMFEK